METPVLYTTAEAADVIAKAGILPGATSLTQRSVARLCKRGSLPGAYLVQGDWCVPQTAIDRYARAVRKDTKGRPPRIKKQESATKSKKTK